MIKYSNVLYTCRPIDDDTMNYPGTQWWKYHYNPWIYWWGGRKLEKTDDASTVLKKAAAIAKSESAFLAMAAEHQTSDKKKATLLEAADKDHYEATVLSDVAENGNAKDQSRLLTEKILPDGSNCHFCEEK